MDILAAKLIAAAISSTSILGAAIGIGLIFSSLIEASARNPSHYNELFSTAMMGFALVEAMAVFAIVLTILIFVLF